MNTAALQKETGLSATELATALAHPKCPPADKFRNRDTYIKRLQKLARAPARAPTKPGADENGDLDLNAMTVEQVKKQKDIEAIRKLRSQTDEGKQRTIEDAYDDFLNHARMIFNRLSDVARECDLTPDQTRKFATIMEEIGKKLEGEM